MPQTQDQLLHWDAQIVDLERRIEEEKQRLASEGGICSSIEVLHLMEQTLRDWRAQQQVIQEQQQQGGLGF
jgi:hypothetical protein